jgi:hypothetical protein
MSAIDPRILRVGIEVSGEIRWYDEGLQITAQGTKAVTDVQNTCSVSITNLSRDVRNYILTETSPFNRNRTPKTLIVEAGRVSTGTARLFVGNITRSSPSQPPDIRLDLEAQTGAFKKGEIVARSGAAKEGLRAIAQRVATDLEADLVFEAPDRLIANYSFSGAILRQVNALAEAGGVDAYLDNTALVVKPRNQPLANRIKTVNATTGMIGIPEATERGVKVRTLFDLETDLGGRIDLTSELNPALNGSYTIYKIDFDLASRDTAWYLDLEASRNE